MKIPLLALSLILMIMLIASVLHAQRPQVVDNSQYFPPYRNQQNIPNCTNFALIYYLKSSIWNMKFNRDPKLEENQFSHSFIWNQSVNESQSRIGELAAFVLMNNVGCASVKDFALNETSASLKPDYKTKEKGLAYKSEKIIKAKVLFNFPLSNRENLKIFVNSLKDSLINGKNFVISLDVFAELIDETDSGEVYNYLEKYSDGSLRLPAHMATVAGYNDTIKTVNGKGAFKVINSSSRQEMFYLDYEWIYRGLDIWGIYFLQENFNAKPELALHLWLKKSLVNENYDISNILSLIPCMNLSTP